MGDRGQTRLVGIGVAPTLALTACLGINPEYDEAETSGATGTSASTTSATVGTAGTAGTSAATSTTAGTATSTTGTGSGPGTSSSTSAGGTGGMCPAGRNCEAGLAIWRGPSDTPEASTWDGSAFSAPSATSPVGDWRYAAGAASPTRNEAIVLAVDDALNVTGLMWDGATWEPLPWNPAASLTDNFFRSQGVIYESVSGDAVAYWSNDSNGSDSVSYRTWDGSAWSPEATISTAVSSRARQINASADPASDEIVMVIDAPGSNHAVVWDGNAWGNALLLATSAADVDVGVVHRQASGVALAICGADTPDPIVHEWDGNTWSAPSTILAPAGVPSPKWFSLGADPQSDRVVVGAQTGSDALGSKLWLSVREGATWETPTLASDTQIDNLNYPNLVVAFEGVGGGAVAVYAANGTTDTTSVQTWTAGVGWSAPTPGPTFPANPNSMTLDPDPFSDEMMLCAQAADATLGCAHRVAGSFAAPTQLTADTTETKNQPWVFLWGLLR